MVLKFQAVCKIGYKNSPDRNLSELNEWITKGLMPKVIYFTESKFVYNMQKFYRGKDSCFSQKSDSLIQPFFVLSVGMRLFEEEEY